MGRGGAGCRVVVCKEHPRDGRATVPSILEVRTHNLVREGGREKAAEVRLGQEGKVREMQRALGAATLVVPRRNLRLRRGLPIGSGHRAAEARRRPPRGWRRRAQRGGRQAGAGAGAPADGALGPVFGAGPLRPELRAVPVETLQHGLSLRSHLVRCEANECPRRGVAAALPAACVQVPAQAAVSEVGRQEAVQVGLRQPRRQPAHVQRPWAGCVLVQLRGRRARVHASRLLPQPLGRWHRDGEVHLGRRWGAPARLAGAELLRDVAPGHLDGDGLPPVLPSRALAALHRHNGVLLPHELHEGVGPL
mmetsp:Transcript_96440/g.311406  ORF Transcript_96440/g.311406 Transcript_96440/m.311406 type:complete len:307 (-) Transcript_96440:228-1148(-)